MSTVATKASPQQAVRKGASKPIGEVIVNGSTAGDAFAVINATATKPSSQIINTADFSILRLIFGGTDGDDEQYNYRVVAWYPVRLAGSVQAQRVWVPVVIAQGVVTLSAATLPAIVAADALLADTVTETSTSPWAQLLSGATYPAFLELDVANAQIVQIETDLTTAASAYVFGLLGDKA